MKMSDAKVSDLELEDGKAEQFFWDDDLPGFAVRMRAPRSKRWYIRYRVGRKQRGESLGDTRKIKLEAARAIARQRFAMVELGGDPAADRARARIKAIGDANTFGVVADRYLAIKKPLQRSTTYKAVHRYLTVHWKVLRPLPLTEACAARPLIATILQEIAAKRGRVSAGRARSNLSALFTWAMGEGLCELNPVTATNSPEQGIASRDRILSDAELRLIWKACGDDDFGRILRLLILTGCRRSEIGDLRWSEIDLDTGVMTIPPERIKAKRTLVLTLPPMAIDILRAVPRRDGRDYLFGQNGRAGFVGFGFALMALKARITGASGGPLAHWTLHDTRRTMRSGLGRIGIAPHVAELVIGHAKKGVEGVYDRFRYDPEIKTALLRWAEHVAGIVEDRPSNVVPMHA